MMMRMRMRMLMTRMMRMRMRMMIMMLLILMSKMMTMKRMRKTKSRLMTVVQIWALLAVVTSVCSRVAFLTEWLKMVMELLVALNDGEEVDEDEDEVERETSPFLGIFLPDVVKDGKPEVLAEMNVNA